MPKGYKKQNMKTQNERNLKKYFYKNRPMYDEVMYNVQKFQNYRYFNNYVPPSESQYYNTNETQSENTEDIITPGGSKESTEDIITPGGSKENTEDIITPGGSKESTEDIITPGGSKEITEDIITPGSSKEPRVISKRNLYINPEGEPDACSPPQTYALGYSHNNTTYWQRASDTYTETYLPQRQRPPPSKKTLRKQAQVQKNKVEATLNKMLSKPVEISKGKSLLEKMGWTGGGLGKDGNGIVNPIVPKATYAVNTLGLGHNSQTERQVRQGPLPKNKDKLKYNHNFQTNVLLTILEFVKNDSEVDLLFEQTLYNEERKKIHSIVEALRTCTDVQELDYVKPLDIEIASEILSYNTYLLQTVSYGKHPARSLRIYKEAPSYVYLITPDDLKDDEEEFKDFCEPLEIDNKDKTENDIETFTEKVKHLEVEKDETRNVQHDHNNINLSSSIEETTITGEDLKTKNDDPNLNHELNVEKVAESKKFMEVEDSTSNVNCQLDSELHSKNDDPKLNHELNVEKVSDSKKFMEVDDSTSNVNCQLDSELHSKNDDPKLNHELNVEKVSDSKKFMEVDDSTSNVNCQLDSELHSKNDDPKLNHELNVEKVSDSKKFMEVDNSSSNVKCQLDSEQHSKTESLECSLNNDKTIEKVLEVENKEKLNLDSNTKIEQEVKNIENENPGNELNESSKENSEKTLLRVIVDYFKEFIEDTNYLEFRFLGPFSNEELVAINRFFNICLKMDSEDSIEKIEILKALNNEVYDIEIKEDLNGSNVVYKSEKCLQEMTTQ